MPKITKREVDALQLDPDKDVFLWDSGDGALKGFGIRMKKSGVASYLIQYRNEQGATRRLVLGRVGTLTASEARDLAKAKLSAVANGEDPSAQRKAARTAQTVSELCDWYLTEARAGNLLGRRGQPIKASTLAMDASRIEQHVKPLIGNRAVASLTLDDMERFQSDIAKGKTAKDRPRKGRTGRTSGGKGVASRTVGMLAAIFAHARMTNNPARGVKRFPDNKGDKFLTLEQIAALGKAMQAAEADGVSRVGIAAVRALLLTGCRKNEILALPKNWLDAPSKCIRFADSKTGKQIRPIGEAAAEFLACRVNGNEWLFPATKGEGHFVGLAGLLDDLCERAEIERISPHVLRHTFGSVAASLGYSELTIAGLLGHASRGVTQRYSHVPDKALLAAADAVSSCIADALNGRVAS